MRTLTLISVLLTFGVATTAFAGDYDFDYGDKNKMRGAWKMCATKGFNGGDCPKVYQKCHVPPMIYHHHGHTKSYCTDEPSFGSSEEDNTKAHDEATRRVQQGIPTY